MEITVKILEIGKAEWIKNAKGGYEKVSVRYSGDKGEQARNFVSYDADIYSQVKKLTVGSTYEVTIEKEGNYWNWKKIVEVSPGGSPSVSNAGRPGGTSTNSGTNWDARLQFDREKQILIIRQSSFERAVEILGPGQDFIKYVETAEAVADYVQHGLDADIPREVEGDVEQVQEVEAPKRGPGRPRAVIA